MTYTPIREKKRTRPRGTMLVSQLPRSAKADAVRADIIDRLRQHEREGTLPRGPRGIFYDLRPYGMPDNPRGVIYVKHLPPNIPSVSMYATPTFVTEQLGFLRRVWEPETDEMMLDENWIADAHAPDPMCPSEVADAEEACENIVAYLDELWLTRQAGQPIYLELRCESADLRPRLARVALPYGVRVDSGGGFDGLKPKKQAGARAAARRDVQTIIGHIGDLDLRGGDIHDAFSEDAIAWAKHRAGYDTLDVVRLALTRKQAAAHDLLDAEGKSEVEGLPVPVLDKIVRDFIESHLDSGIARALVEREPAMRAEAARLAVRRIRKQAITSGNSSIIAPGDWSWARRRV